ncbi:MAG: glucose-6-phosphate isomerase [Dehalococcoidia bacterium]|jgi:glucose-6-phosphate isomerase/transaldolase/glucose-6-phosphate isomerase|nr:glucose-6-phosphate isomerase [Dehalococcoidia bacterium]
MMRSSEGAPLPADATRAIDDCLAELESLRFTTRIHDHDATLWRGNEDESRQRLGWLYATDTMAPHVVAMGDFSARAAQEGVRDVVLLGMGGSSLGAEVLNQTIGSAPGFPRLHVLDSTVPSAVAAVARAIDLRHTMFIVSSKSGSTLEPNLLYEYFWSAASTTAGAGAGAQFVAITDAGSSLHRLADDRAFRRTFLNPADIGGRYSVLSLFGLVPAALLGIDPGRLLNNAAEMSRRCARGTDARSNPSTQLGAYIAGCTRIGRNKLTLVTSPRLQSFGLWAEQLIAESTGKDGKGVIPVTGEPELPLQAYAADRAFAYLRLHGDDNSSADRLMSQIGNAGAPCLSIDVADTYALAGEFYRWEYATAVAGALLGVNPFDQPDVQRAKDASTKTLQHFVTHGAFPPVDSTPSVRELLASLRPSDYFGIMAYMRQTPDTDAVFHTVRRRIGERYRISTTMGYGPRFLHSTGQLHKGGPDQCVLLQVVTGHPDDLPVPGKAYSFGTVADSQALGDLQALQSLKRRVGRIVLEDDEASLLSRAFEAAF